LVQKLDQNIPLGIPLKDELESIKAQNAEETGCSFSNL
jgi:hypothetical protein